MSDIAAGAQKAFAIWNHHYMTRDGVVYVALRCEDLKKNMRQEGWRNVSHLDEDDFKEMGFTVLDEAQYVQGAHSTGRWIRVLTLGRVVRRVKDAHAAVDAAFQGLVDSVETGA